MAHALLLGEHVAQVISVGGYLYAHIFHYFKTIAFQADTLDRVVGDQTHFLYAELAENLCAYAIVALVGFVAEMEIGVYGVKTFFLKLVGSDFFLSPMPRPS